MKITIPNEFLTVAESYGIDKGYAVNLYLQKKYKKEVATIAFKMALDGIFETESAARAAISAAWKEYNMNAVLANSSVKTQTALEPATYLDQAREALTKIIGDLKETTYKGGKVNHGQVDVVSDFHVPFMNPKALATLLTNPAEELWILGDILDLFSISRFRSNIDYITTRDELAQGRALLEELAQNYKTIKILGGSNHDDRALRKVQDLCPQLMPFFVHPTVSMSLGLNNVQILSTQVKGTSPSTLYGEDLELPFMGTQDNCILGHFDNFVGEQAAEQLEKWVNEFDHVLDLDVKPNIFIQAHTHRLGMKYTPKGSLLINCGCMCKVMPYVLINHGKYPAPTPGYVKLQRDSNGMIDPNRTQLICLEAN